MEKKKELQIEKSSFPLKRIYFYLTSGCNLKCCHCWIKPPHQNEKHIYPSLSIDFFESILEQSKKLGLKGIKLTGGEPLMHPQIFDILDLIKIHQYPLAIETNGTLCTIELARKIADCMKVLVSVSLDSADPETHDRIRGIKGSFNSALEGIKNLVEAGISTQIIFTVMERNKRHLESVVRLAESLKAISVKFNIVQPVGRGKKLKQYGGTLSIEELIKLGKWVENELSSSTNLNIFYNYPPAFRSLGNMFGGDKMKISLCGILEIIGVLADGSYALCGIGTQVPKLVFGNVESDSLEDVWNNSPILKELREGIPHKFKGICGKCLMRAICRGKCIAQNYFDAGSFWESYWFCNQAHDLGLFPPTRICP